MNASDKTTLPLLSSVNLNLMLLSLGFNEIMSHEYMSKVHLKLGMSETIVLTVISESFLQLGMNILLLNN